MHKIIPAISLPVEALTVPFTVSVEFCKFWQWIIYLILFPIVVLEFIDSGSSAVSAALWSYNDYWCRILVQGPQCLLKTTVNIQHYFQLWRNNYFQQCLLNMVKKKTYAFCTHIIGTGMSVFLSVTNYRSYQYALSNGSFTCVIVLYLTC